MIVEAIKIAEQADVIVAVVGEAKEHSGESSSRTEIDIPKDQRPLLEALYETAKRKKIPLVLVVMSGRPLTLGWENEHTDSILMTWHGGTETGNGIADILIGEANPSERLTTSFPHNVGQVPIYYAQPRTGRPLPEDNDNRKFSSCYSDVPSKPLFPFGYGLSYTDFSYSPVHVNKTELKGNQKLKASILLSNIGDRAGEEVVQLYVTDLECSRTRPIKELKGFQKILLRPGETKKVEFELTTEDLKFFVTKKKQAWEAGNFDIHIGRNAEDTQQARIYWDKPTPKMKHADKPTLNTV